MATDIYIISGFLGAGKTTFIRKLLDGPFRGSKVVLIENDFGEISVDAAILKSGSIAVRELNSGCICCSLAGDFDKALIETIRRYEPDKIVIEPSGVGKLSAIEAVFETPALAKLTKIRAKITVADAIRCRMYLDNFGEFFEDQIEHADVLVLSRTDDAEKTKKAVTLLHTLNSDAPVYSVPWDRLDVGSILSAAQRAPEAAHHHDDCCGHDHGAEEAFDTVTIRTDKTYTPELLKARFSGLVHGLSGNLLRAKGLVRGSTGYLELQYVQGELNVTTSEVPGDIICFIGKNLSSTELHALFDGK